MRGARECLDDESAARFALGDADADERARAEHHLDTCDTCRRRVAALAVGSSAFTSFVFSDDLPTAPAHGGAAITEHVVRPPRGADGAPAPGDRIGRFAVLRTLGRGGMGVVVAAHDPELDRDVAIKLVHPAVWRQASAQARELLRAEARAMARLVHPNVVTVHDLGTLDDQLFVAMELVDGASLDQWLRAAPRTWREILDVCLQAGRGIAAAHRAGLVHRDIKPHNVLVDREGRARIADFGLAALGGADGHDGTPAYMSPEQHAGGRVDAASDQFGYCVLVYEALFGVRPFEGATVAAVGEAVLAGRMRAMPRGPVPARIRRAIARGLSVDRARRFARMEDLLAALEPRARRRWLAAVPVVAAAAVVGALVGDLAEDDPAGAAERAARAAAGDVWNPGRRAAVAGAIAQAGGAHAGRTNAVIAERLDALVAQWIAARVDVAARNRRGDEPLPIAERRRTCLERRLGEVRAIVDILVDADATVAGKAVEAVHALAPPSVCLQASIPDETAPVEPARRKRHDELRARLDRGRALQNAGKYGEARALFEEVAAGARELGHPALLASVLRALGDEQRMHNDYDGADRTLQDAIAAAERAGDEHSVALGWLALAEVAAGQGRIEAADERMFAARAALARVGDDALLEADLLGTAALVDMAAGRFEDAVRHARERLALVQRTRAEDELAVAAAERHLSTMLGEQHREEEALPLARQALARAERVLGPDHPELGHYLLTLTSHLHATGSDAEALALAERAVAVAAPGSAEHAGARLNLASLVAFDDPGKAIAIYRAVLDEASGDHADTRANALTNLTMLLYRTDDLEGAARTGDEAIEHGRRVYGAKDARLAPVLGLRGAVALDSGDTARAIELCGEADALATATWGEDDLERLLPLACLAQASAGKGDLATAIRHDEIALRIADANSMPHYKVVSRTELASLLARAGQKKRARKLLEEAKAWATEAQLAGIREQLRALR